MGTGEEYGGRSVVMVMGLLTFPSNWELIPKLGILPQLQVINKKIKKIN